MGPAGIRKIRAAVLINTAGLLWHWSAAFAGHDELRYGGLTSSEPVGCH
jgi:hypothetical protein